MVRRISKEYLSQEASVLTPDFLNFFGCANRSAETQAIFCFGPERQGALGE